MHLRPVEQGDHEWLVELHNDPEVLRNLTHPQPITLTDHMQWWAKLCPEIVAGHQDRKVFCIGHTRIGFTKFYDIDVHNRNCVLGADIHKDHRGKGYAKPMWNLMLSEAFGTWDDFHRVSLTTASFNTIGQRVYSGLGFKEEGRRIQALLRDGEYHDMIDMYMLRSDWSAR